MLRVRCQAGKASVVATREAGKNGKLVKALEQHNIACVELPLIEHAAGPDRYDEAAERPTAIQALYSVSKAVSCHESHKAADPYPQHLLPPPPHTHTVLQGQVAIAAAGWWV